MRSSKSRRTRSQEQLCAFASQMSGAKVHNKNESSKFFLKNFSFEPLKLFLLWKLLISN